MDSSSNVLQGRELYLGSEDLLRWSYKCYSYVRISRHNFVTYISQSPKVAEANLFIVMTRIHSSVSMELCIHTRHVLEGQERELNFLKAPSFLHYFVLFFFSSSLSLSLFVWVEYCLKCTDCPALRNESAQKTEFNSFHSNVVFHCHIMWAIHYGFQQHNSCINWINLHLYYIWSKMHRLSLALYRSSRTFLQNMIQWTNMCNKIQYRHVHLCAALIKYRMCIQEHTR
jgi:hypothetical protein